MITKYRGAASELNNPSSIALVYSTNQLNESQIPDMYPEYFGTGFKLLIDASNDAGKIVFNFYTEGYEFEFNTIVFYNADRNPIGFTTLTDPIDLSKYNIELIVITPNFIINSSASYIEVSIKLTNYLDHISNTDKVHKNLVSSFNKSITTSELDKINSSESGFTNQLLDGIDSNKLYRYSGNFSIGDRKINQLEFDLSALHITPNAYIDDPKTDISQELKSLTKIVKLNNSLYLISYSNQNLTFIDLFNLSNAVIVSCKLMKLGTNFCVISTEESNEISYSFVDTIELSRGNISIIESFNSSIANNLKLATYYPTNEIFHYWINNAEIEVPNNKLNDFLSRLDYKITPNISEILGFSEGALVCKTWEGNTIIITNATMYKDDDLIPNGDINISLDWDEFIFISNKTFLIRLSTNWYLLQLNKIENINSYTPLFINLGGVSNWKRLDLLSRTQINPMNINILMSPVDGQIWKYTTNNQTQEISALSIL